MSTLVMRRPDDWHLHLRDGAALHAVLPFSAARFARALVMPNLTPPLTTTEAALAYRRRIQAALPSGVKFEPLMTLYLTDTTPAAEVDFALAGRSGIAATVTAQHLLMNRNALFAGGLRPHHYCLPPLKAEVHRAALLSAVAGGSPRLFLGTDSAPHARHAKEAPRGCAGIFSAHAGIELYAEAFESARALERLEAFASCHGADFYGLPPTSATLTLVKEPWEVPERYPFGADELVPLRAGERIAWRLARPSAAP